MSQILLKLYSWLNKSDSRYASSNFVNHSYDYRPNWTPLSPVTITYYYYNDNNNSLFIWGNAPDTKIWYHIILKLITSSKATID